MLYVFNPVCNFCLFVSRELFSPSQKYQLLVYHADALFHDKEYRNAACKYTMALQQKKSLSKTSKVRPFPGSTTSSPQAQSLPSEIEVRYKIAECYTILKLDKDAIAVLEGIPTRQRTPKINMMLANLYKKAGQERSAVTSYKEVIRQCPLALDAIIGLLSLSVKGAEVASMAMDVIQSIPNLDWLSVWIKAYAFIHSGDNMRAINTICSLEKKSLLRDNVDLLISLADLYFRAGDTKNSILKFEQAQMLDPYVIKGEPYKEAVRISLEKKSLLRDNVDLLISLADLYFRAGDTKNSILKFEQAQMLDPYVIKVEKHPYQYRTEPSRVGCASGEASTPVSVPSPHGSDVPVEKHPYPYRTEPSRVGCASGEAPIPVSVPSPHGSGVPVEKHPYPYRTEPSRVGCASGEASTPVSVPSPHGSDVPVEKHPYPYRTEPSRVGCASGEAPVPVPYRALTGRMCQWRSTRTRTVPSPHRSDVPVENHPYPYHTEPSQVGEDVDLIYGFSVCFSVCVCRCHSFYSKRYSRALYLGAKAIQLNSNSVQALLLKGAALRNMVRVQEAIIHFREAMRLAPCRLDCYEGKCLIDCYLASNSIREAMGMANNVYKTLGANAQTLTILATVCLEDPMTQEKAKTLLDKALAQRPDYIKAVVKKGELLSREQKYEEGISLLRNALANQSDCVLHRMLGDFLVAVNDYQEAMDQYSIALSLDPNDQKSLEGMQKMEKEESPTEATADEDVDDMEGSGEEGDLEGSDSEAAQWADQEQWFGMQ
ncbi:UNVERIFIED_CONTAM: hypothetical protein FKN15_041603 [Acipenser sinensis]